MHRQISRDFIKSLTILMVGLAFVATGATAEEDDHDQEDHLDNSTKNVTQEVTRDELKRILQLENSSISTVKEEEQQNTRKQKDLKKLE